MDSPDTATAKLSASLEIAENEGNSESSSARATWVWRFVINEFSSSSFPRRNWWSLIFVCMCRIGALAADTNCLTMEFVSIPEAIPLIVGITLSYSAIAVPETAIKGSVFSAVEDEAR
ncbi:MAG: hypothetical protein VX498_06265 [Myxococcota bacterium]|nr:hypothetical protein [Myxococcota bacterium]